MIARLERKRFREIHCEPTNLIGRNRFGTEYEQQSLMVGIRIEGMHLTGAHLEDIAFGNSMLREIHPMRSAAFSHKFQKVKAVTRRRSNIDVHLPLPQLGKLDHFNRRTLPLRVSKAEVLNFIFDG